MKNVTLLACLGFLAACAVAPIPHQIANKVAQIPTKDLPVNNSLEQTRCSQARFRSFDKRMECKIEVRRELAARAMMHENNAIKGE